jgi:hypothetical protein
MDYINPNYAIEKESKETISSCFFLFILLCGFNIASPQIKMIRTTDKDDKE